MTRWVPLVLSVFFILAAMPATAQEGGDGGPSEISLFVGSLLPNQVDGVSEILPVFGGRYGMALFGVRTEAGFANSHAYGVDFTTFSFSARADLPALEQFVGSIYGGLDLNYYIPEGATERQSDTGGHVGLALMMHTSSSLWLRSDLKFMVNPGTSLALLFGLVFRPEGGGQ